MRKLWNKLTGSRCRHPHTVVGSSVGVRRSVCGNCGHISFKMLPKDREPRTATQPPLDKAVGL